MSWAAPVEAADEPILERDIPAPTASPFPPVSPTSPVVPVVPVAPSIPVGKANAVVVDRESSQQAARSAVTEDSRDYDADEEDHIPEDENFAGFANGDETEGEGLPVAETKEPESTVPLEVRMKQAVEGIAPEIRETLEEQLRGRFVGLRKLTREKWI